MAVGQQVLSGIQSLELLRAAEEAVEATLAVDGRARPQPPGPAWQYGHP